MEPEYWVVRFISVCENVIVCLVSFVVVTGRIIMKTGMNLKQTTQKVSLRKNIKFNQNAVLNSKLFD